jgi:hypothetical protein
MTKKIYTWILVIASVKLLLAFTVRQMGIDPRRDIATKERLCNAYQPNTIFIGTSRTLYGVNPTLFDSLNQQKTRSYNLGLFSLSSSNAYALAHRMIKENNHVKKIFIELSALDHNTILLRPKNLIQEVSFRFHVTSDAHYMSWHDKISDFLYGLNITFSQTFSIASELDAIKNRLKLVTKIGAQDAKIEEQGHQIGKTHLSNINGRILEYKTSASNLINDQVRGNPNLFYISQITELIRAAKSHGKEVIFYIPNNLSKSEESILSEVVPFMEQKNLLRIPVDEHFEQLFLAENLIDNYHLNLNGSRIYTTLLANRAQNL